MTSRDNLTKRMPRTDAEWARDVSNRLRALEGARQAVRIGRWVLSVDSEGELIATAVGRRVVLTLPQEADEVAGTATLHRVFTVTVEGSPTGGTFTLRFKGAIAEPLDYNASATDIKDALVALSSAYTDLDFDVSGSAGGPWYVTVPAIGDLSVYDSDLTGGTDPRVTVERGIVEP